MKIPYIIKRQISFKNQLVLLLAIFGIVLSACDKRPLLPLELSLETTFWEGTIEDGDKKEDLTISFFTDSKGAYSRVSSEKEEIQRLSFTYSVTNNKVLEIKTTDPGMFIYSLKGTWVITKWTEDELVLNGDINNKERNRIMSLKRRKV